MRFPHLSRALAFWHDNNFAREIYIWLWDARLQKVAKAKTQFKRKYLKMWLPSFLSLPFMLRLYWMKPFNELWVATAELMWRSNAGAGGICWCRADALKTAKATVGLKVAPVSSYPNGKALLRLAVFPTIISPFQMKACARYLKGVVRVNTAPAALLQLHLRVEILLVLLHDVRQVRASTALRVVLLAVAVVVMGVVMVLLWNSSQLWSFFINTGLKWAFSDLSATPLGGAAAFKALTSDFSSY